MTARRRIGLVAALVCGLLPLFGGVAVAANALIKVEAAYAASGGAIPACKISAKELNTALGQIPSDVAQYDADLINAIHQALSARAGGACGKRGSGSAAGLVPGSPGPAGGSGSGSAVVPLRPLGSATQAGIPAPLVILAALGALALVAAALWGAGRYLGWDPAWARAWRHAWREAGFRVGQAWAGVVERLGAGR
jgi:hypothetical protein